MLLKRDSIEYRTCKTKRRKPLTIPSLGSIIHKNSASTPTAFPWGIRYRKDKASIRGEIVLRDALKE
jgi:hypothetical protein